MLFPLPNPSVFLQKNVTNYLKAALAEEQKFCRTGSDLHVQYLLESVCAAVSKELDVIVDKHNWGLVWGHNHLSRQEIKEIRQIL